MHGFWRDDDGFAASQYRGRRGCIRIAGPQVSRLEDKLAGQQIFGMLRRQPAAVFGDADGDDFVLVFIDCIENGRGLEQ